MNIRKCLNFAKKLNKKYIAFSKNPKDKKDNCYMSDDYKSDGNFVTKKEAEEENFYEIFKIPEEECPQEKNIYECLNENLKKDSSLRVIKLRKEIKEMEEKLKKDEYKLHIANNPKKLQNMSIKELRNSFFNKNKIEKLRKELESKFAKIDELKEVENTLNSFSKSISEQLADKNKLLQIKNSEVQQIFNNLEKTNDSINTVTKNIYKNQSKTSLNLKMEKILHVSLIIIIILLIFMVIYYGVKFAQSNYPEQLTNIRNSFGY